MISADSKYGLIVKWPAVRYTAKGEPFTTCVVSEKVKGKDAPANTYQQYNIIVWGEAININSGDKLFVDEITSVSSGWYKGRIQITLSCKIHVEKLTDAPYISSPEEASFAPLAKQDSASMDFSIADDTPLPFDL